MPQSPSSQIDAKKYSRTEPEEVPGHSILDRRALSTREFAIQDSFKSIWPYFYTVFDRWYLLETNDPKRDPLRSRYKEEAAVNRKILVDKLLMLVELLRKSE